MCLSLQGRLGGSPASCICDVQLFAENGLLSMPREAVLNLFGGDGGDILCSNSRFFFSRLHLEFLSLEILF